MMSEPTLSDGPPGGTGSPLSRLHEEQRARWERGARVPVEAYLGWYPALRADETALLDLIYNEVLLREEAGEVPQLDEYLARFPHLADPLREQFEVHRALESDHLFTDAPTRVNPPPPSLLTVPSPPPGGVGTETAPSPPREGEGMVRGGERPRPLRPALPPPDVPGYEILDELGRGGAGVVYRAWQTGLKRTAALKMLLAGTRAEAHELARLRTEAQAAGRLRHPNIVQVYEVGPEGGACYIAMEYVEGGSLARKLTAGPLPPGPAAGLVETLARAVHHAHQQQVIHRDLKPANVLLTADGTPKVTDFGLAKLLVGGADQTQPGSILGTPHYMAPEQASGHTERVGPAADVYALGAILYEVLTGRPPFQGADLFAILEQVRSHEPVPPRRLQPKLPRDLETICLKCLEKEPGKRYPTAEALADDLRRFQAGEPITARPAGAAERVLKWARRRPAVAGLAAALVLVAASAFAAVTGLWLRAEKQHSRAQENLRLAWRTGDDLYRTVAEESLADEPQSDPLHQDFLKKAFRFYKVFDQEEGKDPGTRREVAQANFRLGQILRSLNQHDKAKEFYHQAIKIQKRLCGEFPADPRYCQDLAKSYNWLGELLREKGRPTEAEPWYRLARGLQENLVSEYPDNYEYKKELALSRNNLGLVAIGTGRTEKAREDLDEAVERLTELEKESPERPDCCLELARSLINRGILRRKNKDLERALVDYHQAIDRLTALRHKYGARAVYLRELAFTHNNLGNLLYDLGRDQDALQEHQQALALFRDLVADFPDRPGYQQQLANTHNSLGRVCYHTHDWAGAEQNWSEAVRLFDKMVEKYPGVSEYQKRLGMALHHLGLLRYWQKDWTGCRSYVERAVKKILEANPADPECQQALREQYQTLAEACVQLGDHERAAKAAEEMAHVFADRPLDSYYAACFVARCIPLARKDASYPDDAARQALGEKYAERAVAFLREAIKREGSTKGRWGSQRLKEEDENKYFGPLEKRPEFGELRSKLPRRSPGG
jgi:tetratricopeptide (TPR) repeat protein